MRVENTIRVDAPPEVVWAVTENIDRWPEWTPTVTAATRLDTGPFRLGSAARIKQPMQPVADWVVTDFQQGRRFIWETHRPGLHLAGTHEIVPDGRGTRNILRAEATGWMALMLWPLLRIVMPRALADENRGLRARCEEIAKQSP